MDRGRSDGQLTLKLSDVNDKVPRGDVATSSHAIGRQIKRRTLLKIGSFVCGTRGEPRQRRSFNRSAKRSGEPEAIPAAVVVVGASFGESDDHDDTKKWRMAFNLECAR